MAGGARWTTGTNNNKDAIKAEYSIILQALKVANLAFGRVVNIDEIAEAILPKESKQLEEIYVRDRRRTISYILTRLIPSGLVFSLGRIHNYGYYGSVDVLDPTNSPLPLIQSRRQRVLELIRAAVSELRRAVRMGDILEYATGRPECLDLSNSLISRSVVSLAETGELRVIDSIRGDSKGMNLYLPHEMDPSQYDAAQPLTWMQEITAAFEDLWDERIKTSSGENRKPKPISTGEVRAKISASSPGHHHLKSPYDLINSLQQLAKTGKPVIRKVGRTGQKAVLWAPASATDKELDFNTYANDAERIGEAVQRAAKLLGRPVNIRDVKEEIKCDPSLQLTGSSKLYEVLADVSKKAVEAGNGKGRVRRVTQRIYKVGKIDGEAYYCSNKVPEACVFVQFHQLKSQWSRANHEEDLNNLETCSLSSVAAGRAMLIEIEAKANLQELENILKSKQLDNTDRHDAEKLCGQISEVLDNAKQWLTLRYSKQIKLPFDIDISVPGWTAQELLQVIKPLYPQAQKITRSAKFISLMFGSIRQIPNPIFKSRFSTDPRIAAEFLYDRADALLYSAKQWGGYECCFQAMLACNELGRLRDPRFVIADLESKSFEARLACVACLAFLWSDEGNKRLRDIAVKDPDPGVRQSALWAYGFAGGKESFELLSNQERNDPHAQVRVFAKETLMASQDNWWTI